MELNYGSLVISLDFELLWGILDHKDLSKEMDRILGVHKVVPKLLDVFQQFDIHATWGIVGMLANQDFKNWENNFPAVFPTYEENSRSPYERIKDLSTIDPSCLFAPDLIKLIKDAPYQEIGMHTYSHYYCCEPGQTKEAFNCDLIKEIEVLSSYSTELESLIFPRNQFNDDYADILKQNNVNNYRGNESSWCYQPCSSDENRQWIRRGVRLIDMYMSVSGHNCFHYSEIKDKHGLNNIRSSRLLRPYSRALRLLEPIRMKRIKSQMKYAAKHNCVFHLWWHPHNFGVNMEKNIENLKSLLSYYLILKEQYGMRSMNMEEIGGLFK